MANVLINAPKKVKKGEAFEVKTLILHPMETGFRTGTSGRLIPRNIIEEFVATYDGAEVFRMKLSPAIAANPFVSFHAAVQVSGTMAFRWTGDEGFAIEQSVAIAVE
jgi:sulfur-oxidizing protein SoxZ